MKKILFISTLFICGLSFGQQDPHFTQYFDNTLHVNPAYAGSSGMLSATAIHREQWVGFTGAPRSTTFSLHTPLNYRSVGLGLTAVNDMIGPIRQNMVYVDFSYSLKLGDKSKLAFGLKGGVNLLSVSTLQNIQAGDDVLNPLQNQVNPNFGFGVYYHNPHFFAGISSPRILENSPSATNSYTEQRHLFAIVGGVFPITNTWKLRPSLQAKGTTGAPLSLDLSVAGIYSDKLWLGAMYRMNAAMGVFVQYQISQQFRLGLASEFGTTALRNYNNGTFEVMMSYDFNFKKSDVKSPRYF
ncbi:MAG: type IX secretion system membrane protein PorP/SprF [Flavobacteriia bacterium]